MDLFVLCVACLTVFVKCLVKQFAICFGVVVILLNVMVLFSVVGCALLDRPCLVFQSVCVSCACAPSVRLDAPSICFVCVFVCQKLFPHLEFENWITGVCYPYVVSLCDFAYYVFG